MPTPGLKARLNALLVSPLTWTRLKNDRHSAPVVVKGLIGRTAPWDPFGRIFFVVERTLLPGLKTVKLFKTHFKPGAQ